MAKKTAPIPVKPLQAADRDKWVSGKPAKPGNTKRLTLDLDEDLHRRVKVACTIRGSTMVEEITKLLENEFRSPEKAP